MAENINNICSGRFLGKLAQDQSGNTLAMMAAALLPLMAMVGGGFDMSRSYLAQSRLQQACDAGVLAARKRLGADTAVTGEVSDEVADTGQRFFNINFRDGAYGSEKRSFIMTLGEDYAIEGKANVSVPTSIMRIFGHEKVDIAVSCEAQINFSNTDIMMVLDSTGSMSKPNPGDTVTRFEAMKETIRNFHTRLQSSSKAGSRIRYGFVPYATNVNVAHLLKDEWIADEWVYQSREGSSLPRPDYRTYWTTAVYESGTHTKSEHSTYPASFTEEDGYYCPTKPPHDIDQTDEEIGSSSEPVLLPYPGTRTITTKRRTRTGKSYSTYKKGDICHVVEDSFENYVDTYQQIHEPWIYEDKVWHYAPYIRDVSDFRTIGNGCIEERDTYDITDYDNVDLNRALDLNLDLVPTNSIASAKGTYTGAYEKPNINYGDIIKDINAGKPGSVFEKLEPTTFTYNKTQWRPMYHDALFARAKTSRWGGEFNDEPVLYSGVYERSINHCPPKARKLAPMNETELEEYFSTLYTVGNTYHDIGMIWGGRLISPTGLFKEENADTNGALTGRHLIFLTDGLTEPVNFNYTSYGLEPLDKRRRSEGFEESEEDDMISVIEKRFVFACDEVSKRNITIWVVGFGIELTDPMRECAGPGHYFEAADAAELNASFATIADSIAELRVSK